MASVYERKDSPWLWIKYRDASGVKRQKKTHYRKGDSGEFEAANKMAEAVGRRIDAERRAAGGEVLTVRLWAQRWIAARRAQGVVSARDDETRLVRVLQQIGDMLFSEVRPQHIRATFKVIIDSQELAPKTIRNTYGTTSTMFQDAVADEVLAANPCVLRVRRGELPELEDKDPTWRAGAIFNRHEIERLISDELVPVDRRVLYALAAFTGQRIGESSARRWCDLDMDVSPLGRLMVATSYRSMDHKVASVKTKKVRWVPVHPVLAQILRVWRLSGWPKEYGRPPTEDDLIVPCLNRKRNHRHRSNSKALRDLLSDLESLGMRRRRVHDFRRTFISELRAVPIDEKHVQLISHGPRNGVMSDYTTLPWDVMCRAVSSLRFRYLEGRVLAMASGLRATPSYAHPETSETISGKKRAIQDSNPRKSCPEDESRQQSRDVGSAGVHDSAGHRSSVATVEQDGPDPDPHNEPDPGGFLARARAAGFTVLPPKGGGK